MIYEITVIVMMMIGAIVINTAGLALADEARRNKQVKIMEQGMAQATPLTFYL